MTPFEQISDPRLLELLRPREMAIARMVKLLTLCSVAELEAAETALAKKLRPRMARRSMSRKRLGN